jgi:hypothetical protein
MYDQDVALGAIEPRQHDDFIADLQITKSLAEPGFEGQPGLGRSLVPLLRRDRAIDERRLDPTDRLQHVLLMTQESLQLCGLYSVKTESWTINIDKA